MLSIIQQETVLKDPSVMHAATPQALEIKELFNAFHLAAGLMLLLVMVLVLYTCWRFRERKEDSSTPKQTQRNTLLEAFMIGIPILILAYFFYRSIQVEQKISAPQEWSRVADVVITGHQWWWEIEYPSANVITANELHLPVGRPLLLELRTADVIHDWWVPELGPKMDMIPLQANYLSLTIPQAGAYEGACSEFCGAQHAWMRIQVIAQEQKDFKRWLGEQKQVASYPINDEERLGARLFKERSCAVCHRISGTTANGNVGPDLSHFASRQRMLAGRQAIGEEELHRWLESPQEIKPGAYMPAFEFHPDSVRALVHYLLQLK